MYEKIEKNSLEIIAIILLILTIFSLATLNIVFDKESNIDFPRAQQIENQESTITEIIEYFNDNETYLSSNLTEKETFHMKDVKNIIVFIKNLALFSLISLSAIIIYLIKTKQNPGKILIIGSLITIFISLILAISFLNFNTSFEAFHKILFTGNWTFPAESILIRLFPLEFFINAAKNILIMSIIGSIALFLSGIILKRLKY